MGWAKLLGDMNYVYLFSYFACIFISYIYNDQFAHGAATTPPVAVICSDTMR